MFSQIHVFYLLMLTICLLLSAFIIKKLYLTNKQFMSRLQYDIGVLRFKSKVVKLKPEFQLDLKVKLEEAENLLRLFRKTDNRNYGYNCEYIIDVCYSYFCESKCCLRVCNYCPYKSEESKVKI